MLRRSAPAARPSALFLRDFYAAGRSLNGEDRTAGRVCPHMCDTACPERHPRSRPCWAGLYASALPQLATLAIVEAAGPSNAVRVLARCVLTVGTFVAMAWGLGGRGGTLGLQEGGRRAP